MFDPYTGKYPITDDWADHIERGSAGGIDWSMPVGSPIIVPEYARVDYIAYWGTGGHTTRLTYENGDADYLLHNSKFLPGAYVRGPGDVVALSGGARGADGAGNSTGPHLHAHGVTRNGVRRTPFFYLTGPQFAGGTPTPLTLQGDSMETRIISSDGSNQGIRTLLVSVGELTYTETPWSSDTAKIEQKLWELGRNTAYITPSDWEIAKATVDARRTSLGLSAGGGGGAGAPGWGLSPAQFVKLLDDAIDDEKIVELVNSLAARPSGSTPAEVRAQVVSVLGSVK